MFSPRSCEVYLRSEWTLPSHNPKVAPKTIWHDDTKAPNAEVRHGAKDADLD